MGKKHKKQTKSDRDVKEEIDAPMEKGSLKLVLKVGGAPATPEVTLDSMTDDNYSDTERRQRHKKKKRHHDRHSSHRHHERRDFRKTEADTEDGEDSEEELEPVPKRLHLDDEEVEDEHLHGRNLREKKNNEDDKTPLQLCVDYLHKILQRKDTNGFFAFPVTDNIAPGYSSIISHPMDFSTMKTKIDDGSYNSVPEFRNDYELMMNNCMTYNHPDTVYHKEAKRLLSVGLRHMSREKLLHMKRGLPFMAGVTKEELGFDEEITGGTTEDGGSGTGDASRSVKSKVKTKETTSVGRFEAIPDDLTPEEVLDQVQNASIEAANRLSLQVPNSKIGFLRRTDDGTTTLNILNPDDSGFVSEKERVVDLGSLVGKLTSGSGSLMSFKEDKRNKVNPVAYLNYGAFSSYAPVYDSTTANINKEDSDLLLSTYADETGLQYSKSLRNFVADAGDYTIAMVDDLLNVLTSGEHSKVMALLEQREDKEKLEEAAAAAEAVEQQMDDSAAVNADQESSTVPGSDKNAVSDDVGVELSFLNCFEADQSEELNSGNQETQKKLDQTSELLLNLQRTQYERLSEKLPEHLAYVKDPSSEEQELANKVTTQLTELVKQVGPGDLVKVDSVRCAMGIRTKPGKDDATDVAMATASADPLEEQNSPVSPTATANANAEDLPDFSEQTAEADDASKPEDDLLDLFQSDTVAEENDLTENQCAVLGEDSFDMSA